MPQTTPIVFGPQTCGTLSGDGGDAHEWLVADGLGGHAAGTVAGLRTRPEHGLLTVADPVTGARRLGLVALDLSLTLPSGAHVPLYTHAWASGAVDPHGHRHLETFELRDGVPRWRWRVGDVVVERQLAVPAGTSAVAVVHRVLSAPEPVGLAVAAMVTWRDAGGTRDAQGPPPRVAPAAGGVVVQDAYRVAGPGWQPGGGWHLGAATGDGHVEDLWHAGTFVDRVAPGGTLEVSAWSGALDRPPPPAAAVVAAARERAHALVTAAKADGWAAGLVLAADAFVVRGPDGPDVVAGYPGGGRRLGDTACGYEGLFLDTGRAEQGRDLLRARTAAAVAAARARIRRDAPRPVPDAPDAPLWLVHAVDRHVARTGDADLAADLVGPLEKLLRAHLGGRGALRLDAGDELLRLPADGDPADEADGGRVGKPVDVNALWVNALAALADLTDEAGGDATALRARHARARASFQARFPAPEGWLYDVVDGPVATYPLGAGAVHDDPSLRPYQLLAWALPHAPMAGTPGTAALRAVGAALLTPLGLRTLAPSEYGYRGSAADPAARQGTVLPWLLGPYADACAVTGTSTEGLLAGLEAHVREWGTGSVSGCADGDPPHRAGGDPFSARAVAEALRVRGLS